MRGFTVMVIQQKKLFNMLESNMNYYCCMKPITSFTENFTRTNAGEYWHTTCLRNYFISRHAWNELERAENHNLYARK